MNQPVLSNEGVVSFSKEATGANDVFFLTGINGATLPFQITITIRIYKQYNKR